MPAASHPGQMVVPLCALTPAICEKGDPVFSETSPSSAGQVAEVPTMKATNVRPWPVAPPPAPLLCRLREDVVTVGGGSPGRPGCLGWLLCPSTWGRGSPLWAAVLVPPQPTPTPRQKSGGPRGSMTSGACSPASALVTQAQSSCSSAAAAVGVDPADKRAAGRRAGPCQKPGPVAFWGGEVGRCVAGGGRASLRPTLSTVPRGAWGAWLALCVARSRLL